MDDLLNAHCCESAANVELYFMLISSFVFVALFTLVSWRLHKRVGRPGVR